MGRISVGDALSNSWRGFVNNLGSLIVAGILVPIISLVTLGILGPPMMLGLTMMALRAVRGEKVEIGDVFQGLSRFLSAWGATLIILVVFLVLYGIFFVAILGGAKAQQAAGRAGNLFAGLGVVGMLVMLIIMVVLAILFALTFPALADGMGAVEAVSYSVKAGLANIGSLLILAIIVNVVMMIVQSITFGIGSILTSPWGMCVFAEAYNEVARGAQPSGGIAEAEPKPPTGDEGPPPEQQV